MKKAIFFTIDSLLASSIVIISILLVSNLYIQEQRQSNVNYASQDVVRVMSNLKIGEVNNEYVKTLISQGIIDPKNKTIIEQIGEFWSTGDTDLALNLTRNLTEELLPGKFGFSILVNDELIYTRNLPIIKKLVSSRKIISGIAKDKPIEGFTSRVVLSGIESKRTNSYVYFGGFEGEGNLTKILELPSSITSINSSYIEVDTGGDFDLYINGAYSGSYKKGTAGGGTLLADKWTINNSYLSNYQTGNNEITLNFTNGSSYIAGGFLRVRYTTSSINDTIIPGYERNYLPGIDGFINLFSSFYAHENLTSLNLYLHFLSEYPLYLTIGNTTIFESVESGSDQIVYVNNTNISALIDYSNFSSKTVPLRMGIQENVLFFGQGEKADVALITDRTGSMDACDVNISCAAPGICDSNPSGGCHERRDVVAIDADKNFIDSILNITGNEIGLIGYGKRANPACSFHDIGSDSQSLSDRVDEYYNEWCGYTCISCGIQEAIEMLNEKEVLHELNKVSDIDISTSHVGDSGPVAISGTLSTSFDNSKHIKSRLTVFGENVDTDDGYRNCVFFNGNYLGRMCIPSDTGDSGKHTCTYPLKPEWFLSGDTSVNTWITSSQAEFDAGNLFNINTTISAGDAILDVNATAQIPLFYDNFDSDDLSQYTTINGNWFTIAQAGLGSVLRETDNSHTIIYPTANFTGTYKARITMWNEDNDGAGLAFRINPEDGDDFYSCSASADSSFNAGIYRHEDDLVRPPNNVLASSPWTYVRSRWYNVTVTVDENTNTLNCVWESTESGVEFNITVSDDDSREYGSVGFWTSYQDNFRADLLYVWQELQGAGTILSPVYSDSNSLNLHSINWTHTSPVGSNITLQIRSGNTPIPDGTWDNFYWINTNYTNSTYNDILQSSGLYVQWLATFRSENPFTTKPLLSDVTINYSSDFSTNNFTITGANDIECFGTAGEQDDWDFTEVELVVWDAPGLEVNLSSTFDSSTYFVDDGTENQTLSMNVAINTTFIRAATLEFEGIDNDAAYYDCIFVNNNYIGRYDYQKWSGTNEWQRVLFDVPVNYLTTGTNNVTFTSGTDDGCVRVSGENDFWRFRNINLSVTYTNKSIEYDRFKSMLIMSDGEANTKIGDCSNCDPTNARAEAVQKACEAHDNYGITIFSVAFGSVSQTAIDTMNQSACCDDCNNFYTSSNADDILNIYSQIAQSIVNVTFESQSINVTGVNVSRTILYPDSYLDVNYTDSNDLVFGKIPLSFETDRFNNNITTGTIDIPQNTTLLDARVTSYSSDFWTDNLTVNNNRIFSLGDYGSVYSPLGDPYVVEIPASILNIGSNSVAVSTGFSPDNYTGGSLDNRGQYTLLLHGFSDYSSVVAESDGCTWHIDFEDNSSATVNVPTTYTGSDTCYYQNASFDPDDALNLAVYELFKNLDLDNNGLLEINIDDNGINIEIITVSNVPSLWGPAIVELRVWE